LVLSGLCTNATIIDYFINVNNNSIKTWLQPLFYNTMLERARTSTCTHFYFSLSGGVQFFCNLIIFLGGCSYERDVIASPLLGGLARVPIPRALISQYPLFFEWHIVHMLFWS
jgi:hypothetical protein